MLILSVGARATDIATQQDTTPAFNAHGDSAPNFYLNGKPSPSNRTVRAFEHAVAASTATNPITNATDTLTNYMADPVKMKILHMITGDPARTPGPLWSPAGWSGV